MKIEKKNLILLVFSVIVGACNNYEVELETKSQTTIKNDEILHFSNKEMLIEAINDTTSKTLTRSTINPNFRSLMDQVDVNDSELSSLTLSEKAYIVDNKLNYYEAFDYEDLIPNENFARYLNHKAEICCNDTLYKVTGYGTLVAHEDNREELESISEALADLVTYNDNENEKQLSSNVRIINSFGLRKDLNRVEDFGDRFDDGRNEGAPIISGGNNNSSGNTPSSSYTYTNTSLEDIPFNTFPSYSSGSHTFVGKMLEKLFGERSEKSHEFINGYKVNGSMYDYDYAVYNESGIYVSMKKKRGGFFKQINGWKKVDADELVMDLEDMVLSLEIDVPYEIKTMFPRKASVDSYDKSFKYWGRNSKCVNILGYDVKEKDVYKLVGKGVKETIKALKSLCNQNVDEDIKAAQIITPNKAYLILLSHPIYGHKIHKIRKVFNSGVKIGISSSILSNPTSPNSYISLFKFLQGMPHFGIDKGSVRLAGRHNSDWGGMTITK